MMNGVSSFNAFETADAFLQCGHIYSQTAEKGNSGCGIFHIMNSRDFPRKRRCFSLMMKAEMHPSFLNLKLIRIKISRTVDGVGHAGPIYMSSFPHKKVSVFRNEICEILKSLADGFSIAINIQMISIIGSDNSPSRRKL